MKDKLWIGLLLLGIFSFCCGCSGKFSETKVMGRYVGQQVQLPESDGNFVGLVQEGMTIRLVHGKGQDILSEDGGRTFEETGIERDSLKKWLSQAYQASAPDGTRIFTGMDGGRRNYILLTADGEETELMESEYSTIGASVLMPFYGTDTFYACLIQGNDERIYQVNQDSGEMVLLAEVSDEVRCMAADENYLYIVTENGLILYDLGKQQVSAEQDEVLTNFLAGKAVFCREGQTVQLYPYGDGVYILIHNGVYWHERYGKTVEQVVNGRICSISNEDRNFLGMALLETGDRPEFLIAYTDGVLERYSYDETLPAMPEGLHIYSVYEDGNMNQAVHAFRNEYPNVPVVYEVGMDAAYGMTQEDALKRLATEIAAGDGPDILVMDDIPYDAYVEKEVLHDLSSFREGLDGEEYFVRIADAYKTNDGLYTIPLTFAVPVLAGKEESIAGAETLADLADLLEKERKNSGEGPIFSSWDAVSTLRLLAQSSQGAWIEDGKMDREAVEEFLRQAKRIYDAVEKGAPEFVVPHLPEGQKRWKGEYPLERRFDCDGVSQMMDVSVIHYPDQPYHAGYLSGGGEDYINFAGGQQYLGETYVMMPGQQYGTCLVSTLLAVNRATEREEECMDFLQYVFSEEFQKSAELNGTPLNREAYRSRQISQGRNYIFYYSLYNGYHFGWPTEEDFKRLDRILEDIVGANICDNRVYEAVVELGEYALKGERSIEEVTDEIEKKVKLYLAE